MQFGGLSGGLYRIGNWIIRLFILNLLWIFFSLFGLLIFGLFPATIAMYTVVRKWIRENKDMPMLRTFWDSYRTNFLKANAIGFTQLIIAYILYVDYIFLNTLTGWAAVLLNVILISTLILYSVVVLFIFPIFVHYQLKIFQYIKLSIIIGISYPIQTILMAFCVILMYVFIIIIPGLFLFAGSILSYFMMRIANSVFAKIEAKKSQENNSTSLARIN